MSNVDLLNARRHRRNRVMTVSILASLSIVTVGTVFLLLGNIDSIFHIAKPTKKIVTQPQKIFPLAQPQPRENTHTEPVQSEPKFAAHTPIENSPEDHEKFLQAAKRFSNEIKVKASAFPTLIASERYNNLVAITELQLVTLSNQARYKEALAILTAASNNLDAWMLADLERYQKLLFEAETAWQGKQLTELTRIIATAKTLHAGHKELFEHYALLMADWPMVRSAFQRAEKARAENKPTAEQKALQVISQKTHDITGLKKRIAAVTLLLRQQKIDELLRSIAQALAARDIAATRSALKSLSALAPKTPEIQNLNTDLMALEEGIRFDKVIKKMDQLAAADNWNAANQLAVANRGQFHNYEKFQRRADFIKKVNDLITFIVAFLNEPEKLMTRSSQQQAETILDTSEATQSFSPSLTNLIDKLAITLSTYTEPLNIMVLSDSYTFVEVKSIGQVGAVRQKTIKLPPGDYVLLGKREGYVTVRVPLKLRPGDSGKKITVMAHEKI